MIADIQIYEKAFGPKVLYRGLNFKLNAGEKVGLIGRNGTGKSTLLNIIMGIDKEYDGDIHLKKGLIVIASRQEHHEFEDETVVDYIANDLPEFTKLKHILDTYPDIMGSKTKMIHEYTEALDRFMQLGYYEVEEEIITALANYQIDEAKAKGPLKNLSGGQKRLAELVKVQQASTDLALIDEPTNHMDYVAKAEFIKWMQSTKDAIVVISHDRDVLKNVDRIIEIRDGHADIFNGNYDDYLRTNASRISSEINEFGVTQSRIRNLKEDIVRFKRMKEKARHPGTISRFKSLEQRSRSELTELEKLEKPSFWIDSDSVEAMSPKVAEAYGQHKTKNIQIGTKSKDVLSNTALVSVDSLSLGYDSPLFQKVSFELREGERVEIKGRNGVGKTTLVKAVIGSGDGQKLESTIYGGTIIQDKTLRIGVYEQEIEDRVLNMTLEEAVELAYRERDLAVSEQLIRQKLGEYLFNPAYDGKLKLNILSGGQKARYQLICMLAGDPNLLVLDEPTNHLDLPSIEELEKALERYHGAIMYISHDSYFSQKIGGKVIDILPASIDLSSEHSR